MSSLTSFLENRFEMLTKAIGSAGHCISTMAWVSSLPRHVPSPPCHPPSHGRQVSPATQQMQPTQTIQPPQPTGGRRRRVVDEDPDERRRKFLERNRAAATRCRQKRKVWVMSLEKKAEELTQTNMQLQVQAPVFFLGTQRPSVQLAFPVPAGLVNLRGNSARLAPPALCTLGRPMRHNTPLSFRSICLQSSGEGEPARISCGAGSAGVGGSLSGSAITCCVSPLRLSVASSIKWDNNPMECWEEQMN